MNKILYVLLCSNLVLFSCERKVDDSAGKVSVLIPIQNSILQDTLNPLSVANSLSNNDDDHMEEFNSFILPMFGNAVVYPVNCYLIAVGAETSETVFTKNFCGKRSTVTGLIDAQYKFGPFVGLVSAGSDLELTVASGERRKVYVFAIHAQNPAACKTLTAAKGQNPSKENFSRPFLVGTSATFSVGSGQTTTVLINMDQPVAANSIDDCIIPSIDSETENPANRIVLERRNFPYDVLSPALTGDTFPTNKRCDYIDVAPKYEAIENGVPRLKSGFLPAPKTVYVSMESTAQTTYPTKAECESLTNGTTLFPIQTTDTSVRRWLSLDDTLNGTVRNFRVDTTDASIPTFFWPNIKMESVRNVSSTLVNASRPVLAKFDLVVPQKVIPGQCYPFFVTRKSLEDEPLVHAGTTSILNFITLPVGAVLFFNDGTCTNPLVGPPAILPASSFGLYSFRATQNFTFEANESGIPFSVAFINSKNYKIEVVNAASNTQVSSVEVRGSTFLRKRIGYNCYPITFSFKNSDGANVPTTLPVTIEMLFAQNQGNFMSMFFDENASCSGSPIAVGNALVTAAPGSHIYKIYVAVTLGAVAGWRTLKFKVNDGTKIHFLTYRFEVDTANGPP